jgi:hypothetical protein
MSRVSSWLCEIRAELIENFESLDPANQVAAPPHVWWLLLSVVSCPAVDVNDTVKCLQGRDSLLGQQAVEIESLRERLRNLIFAETTVRGINDFHGVNEYVDTACIVDGI